MILREQPPAPETFGLNSATTEMEVMTEFLNPPKATVKAGKAQKNKAVDQDVSWGAMQLGHGKAFDLSAQSSDGKAVAVQRQYGKIAGRDILLEVVQVKDIQTSLKNLPLQASSQAKLPAVASTTLTLPKTPLEQANQKQMSLAAVPAAKGYVLDYVELNTDQGDYTFQGDTTYFISGRVNIGGTASIEGGTVIKYGTDSSINLSGAVNCQTAAYRPAAFTSAADNTIGEMVYDDTSEDTTYFKLYFVNESDSDLDEVLIVPYAETFAWSAISVPAHGSASTYLGDTTYEYGRAYFVNWYGLDFSTTTHSGTITLASDGWTMTYTPWAQSALSLQEGGYIHDVRISNLDTGISSYGDCSVRNAQFVNCGTVFDTENTTLYAGNVLMSHVGTAFYGQYFQATAENITVDQATLLTDCPNENSYYSALNLVNSLLTGVGDPGCVSVTTDHVEQPTSTGIYQTVGAGGYYLADNSPYRHAGTANINPQLLVDLAQKTTYPPVVYPDTTISSATTLSPQATRDNTGTPDLGYHYNPIDYFFGGVVAAANLTFTSGTAVGWFEPPGMWGAGYGISPANDVVVTFNGTATSPCIFTRYETVQEGGNGSWMDKGWLGGIAGGGSYDPANPAKLTASFTSISRLTGGPNNFRDGPSGEPLMVRATDCEIYESSGGYNLLLAFTNCLFYRGGSGQATADSAHPWETYRGIFRNCTFYGGSLNAAHWESDPYWGVSIRDCSFDGTSFDFSPPWNGGWVWTWLDADYNATYNVTFVQEADLSALPGPNNVHLTSGFNWQPGWFGNFYLPPDSPLIDAGSTTAGQLGLYNFTTQASEVPENNSIVDIGYHYPANVDSDSDGLPDWWELKYFGNLSHSGSDMDSYGIDTLQHDYNIKADPNQIRFLVTFPNNRVNTGTASCSTVVLGGVPSQMAILINNNNYASATWHPYNPSVVIPLNSGDGDYDVQVGLRGLASDAQPTWQHERITLDTVAPTVAITGPAGGTVTHPTIQVQGNANEPLRSLTCDINNASGLLMNQGGTVTGEYFDTGLQAYTTAYFQCYNLALANGLNTITVHATDLAGNVTTTSIGVTYSSDSTPPVLNIGWPGDGSAISGDSFTLLGSVDDATAAVGAKITNGGNTTTILPLVKRDGTIWVRDMPVGSGDNMVTITATNAAQQITSVSFNVIRSSVTVTLDPLPGYQLNKPFVNVTGTVSDPDCIVAVNNVMAYYPDEDNVCFWEADNVPVGSSGNAAFDVEAYSGEDYSSLGSEQFPLRTGVKVVLKSYDGDAIYQWTSCDGGLGCWDVIEQENINWNHDAVGKHTTTHISVPPKWIVTSDIPQDGAGFVSPWLDVYGTFFTPKWEYSSLDYVFDPNGLNMNIHRSVNAKVMLVPEGQAVANATSLYLVRASARVYSSLEEVQLELSLNGDPINDFDVKPDLPMSPEWLQINNHTLANSGITDLSGDAIWGETVVSAPSGETKDITPTTSLSSEYIFNVEANEINVQAAVDANRDGNIAFDINGRPGPDHTTADKPYRFWINNNQDTVDGDSVPVTTPNCDDFGINGVRDLEDLSRLHISLQGIADQVARGEFLVGLKWKNVTGSGSPSLNIFPATENDGGTLYLKDMNVAQRQAIATTVCNNNSVNHRIDTTGTFLVDPTFWTFKGVNAKNPFAYLLFEGCSEGKGQLVITINKPDGTELAEAGSVWLDLKDIKEIYQRVKATPYDPNGIPAPFDETTTFDETTASTETPNDGFTFNAPSDETQTALVFVHGSNIAYDRALANGETMFKRLWWQGYKGRFVLFYWNTLVGTFGGAMPAHYNYNEYRAFKYGLALKNYVANGLPSGYTKNVVGHSMGNMVVASALYPRGTAPGMTCQNVIFMQAAVPASLFDSSATTLPELVNLETPQTTPDDFAGQWGYRGLLPANVNATLYNIYNVNDYALGWWVNNQKLCKPENLWTPIPREELYYDWNTVGGYLREIGSATLVRAVTDSQESMSFIARSRTAALGRIMTTGGSVGYNFDVGQGTPVNLGNQRSDHSGEFTRPIQQLNPFYKFIYDVITLP